MIAMATMLLIVASGMLANLLVIGAANAAAVTIDFSGPDEVIGNGNYTEDGFVVDGNGTSAGRIESNELTYDVFSTSTNDFFSITRDDNGLF